ncbi:MAG: PIG-L family deacetylase [Gammaproteobacteria bacterium]|nr:PIG-L family deacetylase [Gammaproteobacteria bacterium]
MLKSIVRRLYKLVLGDEVRTSLASLSLLKLVFLLRNNGSPTAAITGFDARNVLVLAPHMDDEVLGCGGILRLHALAGAKITVIFMTDGSKGNPELYRGELPDEVIAARERELRIERRNESGKAAAILGIDELVFLDCPDGGLQPSPEVVERVLRIILERRPQIIYHPSIFDLHPDHWATNRVLHAATMAFEGRDDWQPVYRGYEVWTPAVINRVADISEVIQAKQDAVAQFGSQLAHTDFARTLLGLNAYRSLHHASGHGYAEAFHESLPALYSVLMQQLSSSPGRGSGHQ